MGCQGYTCSWGDVGLHNGSPNIIPFASKNKHIKGEE